MQPFLTEPLYLLGEAPPNSVDNELADLKQPLPVLDQPLPVERWSPDAETRASCAGLSRPPRPASCGEGGAACSVLELARLVPGAGKMKDFNKAKPADKLKSNKSAEPEERAGEDAQNAFEDAQNAFLLELTKVRCTELRQMAARQEQRIDAWYEDLGCSGRGQFLPSRTRFEALTLAARTGKLSCIFAWDLSRLFRDLVQQELWLEEMEHLGVLVHVQDLPFAMDLPTRRLFRQELGMINEYHAARIGALFSAALHARVAEGLRVGRMYSRWGLRYSAEKRGFYWARRQHPVSRLEPLYSITRASWGAGR